MSLSEKFNKVLFDLERRPVNQLSDPWGDKARREAVAQLITAVKEEGYICVGKETVKKIMGEEEADG